MMLSNYKNPLFTLFILNIINNILIFSTELFEQKHYITKSFSENTFFFTFQKNFFIRVSHEKKMLNINI